MAKFYTRFDHPSPVLKFKKPSRTKDEFRDDADITNIVKRAMTTGFLVDPSIQPTRKPMFGDFSRVPVYQDAWNTIVQARQAFDQLPEKLRRRFNYDPEQLLAFLGDHANLQEAISLGLIEREAPTEDEPAGASKTAGNQPESGAGSGATEEPAPGAGE